jgi:molecular chaperone GrpE
LDHLVLAAVQLKDKGLDMVVNELQMTLREQGLEEIQVMGKAFDVATMEVVEKQNKAEKVTAVVSRGYRLNGEVIRHAKVVLG